MKITTLSDTLKVLFNPFYLLELARGFKFIQRLRNVQPVHMVFAIVRTLSDQRHANLADIHRTLGSISNSLIYYKPFHNQLKKPQLTRLMQKLVEEAMTQWLIQPFQQELPKKYPFKHIHIHDGSSLTLHPDLWDVFPGRFPTAPAAIELHMTLDLVSGTANYLGIDADKESERLYQPYAHELKETLVMMDAGYFSLNYCYDIDQSGGYYIFRAKKNLKPDSCIVRDCFGKPVMELKKGEFNQLTVEPGEYRDLSLEWNNRPGSYRLIAFWDRRNQRTGYLITNLSRDDFSALDICHLYSVRWQIELFFKELKSFCGLKTFITRDKNIVQTLVWGSMLAVLLKRSVAFSAGLIAGVCISTQKVARCSLLWMQNLLEALLNPAVLEDFLSTTVAFLAEHARRANLERDKETSLFSMGLDIYSGAVVGDL